MRRPGSGIFWTERGKECFLTPHHGDVGMCCLVVWSGLVVFNDRKLCSLSLYTVYTQLTTVP